MSTSHQLFNVEVNKSEFIQYSFIYIIQILLESFSIFRIYVAQKRKKIVCIYNISLVITLNIISSFITYYRIMGNSKEPLRKTKKIILTW